MDINAKNGVRVIFNNPNAGYEHHQQQAKEHLVAGDQYTVDRTDVGSWHTDVYLQEVPDVAFNSVLFKDV